MFSNLSLKGFTWPKEPVIYLTLIGSLLFLAASIVSGEYGWTQGLEQLGILVGGFIARGRVSPA